MTLPMHVICKQIMLGFTLTAIVYVHLVTSLLPNNTHASVFTSGLCNGPA